MTDNTEQPARSRLFAGVGAAALLVGGIAFIPPALTLAHMSSARAEEVAEDQERPVSFADLATKVTPAVVNISSSRKVAASEGPDTSLQLPKGSPLEEFFHPFLEQQQREGKTATRNAVSLGSGFVIDPAGYVVTNNHVIEDGTDIVVTTNDGTEYPARIVGTDPRTDLALLKVEANKQLASVHWGNSDQARVGDWVMAVGNPFGLGGSVTTGIVSARSRDIHEGAYDDFLQIDAAINQGNSGGPTFDMDGNVVGINTAIVSPSGGSVGIGFAIPSNLARDVVADLKDNGVVERGWLGVGIQQVTPELALGLGLGEPRGALISSIDPASPAAKAGIQPGDVVLSFNGTRVDEMRDLPRLVAAASPGTRARLDILRDGASQETSVEIGTLKPEAEMVAAGDAAPAEGGQSAVLGARLAPLTDETRQEFGLADSVAGVVIVDLAEDSPLAGPGLRPGDVIERVGNVAVNAPADVERLAVAAKSGPARVLVMLVSRDGHDQFIALKLKEA